MKMIYAEGFSQQDRRQWRAVIFTNLVQAFQTVLNAMEEQGVQFESSGNEVIQTYPTNAKFVRESVILTNFFSFFSAISSLSSPTLRSIPALQCPSSAFTPSPAYGMTPAFKVPSNAVMNTRSTTTCLSTTPFWSPSQNPGLM